MRLFDPQIHSDMSDRTEVFESPLLASTLYAIHVYSARLLAFVPGFRRFHLNPCVSPRFGVPLVLIVAAQVFALYLYPLLKFGIV